MKKDEQNIIRISESLKAMAHPDRINILNILGQKDKTKLSVTEICKKLKLNQPLISRHLSILKNKEILLSERAGSNIYYSVNRNSIIFSSLKYLLIKI